MTKSLVRNLLFAIAAPTVMALSTLSVQASTNGRYLYDLDPHEVDPKSWAVWRKNLTDEQWRDWCATLTRERWKWWRESLGPDNWRHWKETMGPQDKQLWQESGQVLAEIQSRESDRLKKEEEKEESVANFKRKIHEVQVRGKMVPKRESTAAPADNGNK